MERLNNTTCIKLCGEADSWKYISIDIIQLKHFQWCYCCKNETHLIWSVILTDSAICDLLSITLEIPKSPIFNNPDLVRNTFKVFISLKKYEIMIISILQTVWSLCCWWLMWSIQNDEKKKVWKMTKTLAQLGSHLRVLSEIDPINSYMTMFRWFSKSLCILVLWTKEYP